MKGRKRADRDADENLGQKLEPLLTKALFLNQVIGSGCKIS